MKTRSCKAKGRRLQNWVRDKILHLFPELEKDDVKSAIMGESGCDIKLSPHACRVFPYAVEAKNVEKLNVWSAYDQAKEHSDTLEPIVVMKKNGREPLVLVEAIHFLNLVRKSNDKK